MVEKGETGSEDSLSREVGPCRSRAGAVAACPPSVKVIVKMCIVLRMVAMVIIDHGDDGDYDDHGDHGDRDGDNIVRKLPGTFNFVEECTLSETNSRLRKDLFCSKLF